MTDVRPGDQISIRALKADGHAYRWWEETVEAIDAERVVTISGPGKVVHAPGGGWVGRYHARTFYWFDRPYVLVEFYHPDGRLLEIYVHISSRSTLRENVLAYTDHELDVVLKPGQPPEVVDEDEFAAAAVAHGYSPDLQAACWDAVREVLRLVESWTALGIPPQALA